MSSERYFGLTGILLFGDVRDQGIVADYYRKDRNELYYVAGPTRRGPIAPGTERGISRIGVRSRQYDAWNIPLKDGDFITVFQTNMGASYKIIKDKKGGKTPL